MRTLALLIFVLLGNTALGAGFEGTWKFYFSDDNCRNYYDQDRTLEFLPDGECVDSGQLRCSWSFAGEKMTMLWLDYPGYGLDGYLQADESLGGSYINPANQKFCWRGVRMPESNSLRN